MEYLTVGAAYGALLISAFVSVRLLRSARLTGNAPETAMGLYEAFIVLAVLIYAVVRIVTPDRPALLYPLVVTANLMIAGGVVALAVGVWRIYRAGESWARTVCGLLTAWVLVGWSWTTLGEAAPVTVSATVENAFFVAGRTGVYAWGGIEAFRFHGQLRRRLTLGLVQPLVAHQVLLWGLFCVCMGLTAVVSLCAGFVLGDAARSWGPGGLINAGLSLGASYCLWFSFFPPAFYRRLFTAVPAAAAA